MLKCKRCSYENEDCEDFVGIDVNEQIIALDDAALKANENNPDYLTRLYCNECYYDLYINVPAIEEVYPNE